MNTKETTQLLDPRIFGTQGVLATEITTSFQCLSVRPGSN